MFDIPQWVMYVGGYFLSLSVNILLVMYFIKLRDIFMSNRSGAQMIITCSLVPLVNIFVTLLLLCVMLVGWLQTVSSRITDWIFKE